MSTVYKYKKCERFGFAQSINEIRERYDNIIVFDNDNTKIEAIHEYKEMNDRDEIPIFVFDLESKIFDDIIISVDKADDKKDANAVKNPSITNDSYKHDDNELNKIMTGQSTQLDAFSKNLYTVIYGKKGANIQNGQNNTHIFNHVVIDSLAKNGVIADPISNQEISIHTIMRELEQLKKFMIFFVHPALDIPYTEHESPNEISHPVYIKGKGEIAGVAYRALVLRFFPDLTIVTESMRENAYLF